MKTFINVAQMKLATLQAGQFVETGGDVTKGDGGQARYLVTAGASPDDSVSPDLANGNHALYQGVGAVNDLSQTYTFATVAAFKASLVEFPDGKIIHLSDRGADFTKITGIGTANDANIIASTLINQSVDLGQVDIAILKAFGGENGVDSTVSIGFWLDYIISNKVTGAAYKHEYLVESISRAIPNGINLIGDSKFKATGSSRLNMLAFSGATGDVKIDGLTFDGANLVARPFEIKNINSSTLGTVRIGKNARFINAKNVSPASNVASACRVQGNFSKVIFAGEVDNVDNSLTSGGVAVGFWADWTGTYYIRNTVITSTAKISNVKNDNTALADADGMQCMAPVDVVAKLTVAPGATFINCKGRSIKSQVTMNAIDSPTVERTLYDGLIEIDLQYSGGHVIGANINYDGTRVNQVISATSRLNLPSDCTISSNTLDIKGVPSSNTGRMVFVWGTDNTDAIKQQGGVIRDNKVRGGSVDYFATIYGTNVVNVNRSIIDSNWVKDIGISFFELGRVFNNRAQLSLIFTNNGSDNPCTGGTLIASGDLMVERDSNNFNITPLPFMKYEILAGVITAYGANDMVIATEGGAGFDNLDTISGGSYSNGEHVTFRVDNDARAPKFKNGTGNIFLAGSDFELNNMKDRLTLAYDSVNSWWVEVSRSDNGV